MYTVPGPENLHTRPSPEEMPEMMPPEATRSRTYLQFQATRWPLSMMYFSPSTSWGGVVLEKRSKPKTKGWGRLERVKGGQTHVFPEHGSKRAHPQNTRAGDLVHEQALAGEHCLADALVLVLLDHALGAGQERVAAHGPG